MSACLHTSIRYLQTRYKHTPRLDDSVFNEFFDVMGHTEKVHDPHEIEKFIKDTIIQIRLTRGKAWNKDIIAEGATKTLQNFRNEWSQGQTHESKVLLFFNDANNCKLKMKMGLMQDQKYNTKNFNLYKYNNIYFPDENYYNSNPFPKE
jgi:hypothetical protein